MPGKKNKQTMSKIAHLFQTVSKHVKSRPGQDFMMESIQEIIHSLQAFELQDGKSF